MKIGDIFCQIKFDKKIKEFKKKEFDIQIIGPFITGVQTYIIQGGQDECYIFVFTSWIQGESTYKLIYKF